MQKKIIRLIILTSILFVLCVELAEVINFFYMTPFLLPFFLFISSVETELHRSTFYYSIPFLFGLISDLLLMKGPFILLIIYPIAAYTLSFLVIDLKIPKQPIFFLITSLYGAVIYFFNFPIWVCLLAVGSGFLIWEISSYITLKMVSKKENGKT